MKMWAPKGFWTCEGLLRHLDAYRMVSNNQQRQVFQLGKTDVFMQCSNAAWLLMLR